MNLKEDTIEHIELELLLEALNQRYGYDFRNYNYNSIHRRIQHHLKLNKLGSFSELQHHILRDEKAADTLIKELSINFSEMFRDPLFYSSLREKVLPIIKSYQHIKVWHAGCSSGEEVYSMAILLCESGLYQRCQLYATDFNNAVLDQAKQGIFPIKMMQKNTRNYQDAGGEQHFSDYYHAHYDDVIMDANLSKNILFANHNLTTDASFGEMQIIICRNVLIYFNRALQERVFSLFANSLSSGGYLCLGSHETLQLSSLANQFETISNDHRIYRKR